MDTELINILITAAVTLLGGGGVAAVLYRRQNRRLKDSEAVAAELNAAAQFAATVNEMSATIAQLNHTIDDKTARIRQVEDSLAHTERENTRLAEENGELKKENAQTRCHLLDCTEREPPTDRTRRARKKAASATTDKEKTADTETIKDPDNE